ncbi:FtsQ-type POTRA domain-containing protein [bacterium]|nr:FtsQ-type POTRA domain-containing protein [bacterium]
MKKTIRISSIVLAFMVLGISWALSSSYFTIRRIEFYGLDTVSEMQIHKKLTFHRGENLLSISTKKAEREILTDRRIESVTIKKCYPDGVIVEINEKKPQYLLNCGELWGVTKNCEAIPIKDYRKLPNLPIIDNKWELNPKAYYPIPDSSVIYTVAFLNRISRERPAFLDEISEIYSPNRGEYEIYLLQGGIEVRMIDKPETLDRLAIIMNKLRKDEIDAIEIDLRFPGQGIVRYNPKNTNKLVKQESNNG